MQTLDTQTLKTQAPDSQTLGSRPRADATRSRFALLPRHLDAPNGRRPKYLLGLADAAAVLLAAGVVSAFVPLRTGDTSLSVALLVVAAAAPVWIAALLRQRLYTARCISRRVEEIRRIVGASSVSVATLAAGVYALDVPVSRPWLILLLITATITLSAERELARRLFLRVRRGGGLRRRVVVVGANHEAFELARMMDTDPVVGYEVVGFVTDLPEGRIDPGCRDRVVGGLAGTLDFVFQTGASGVVIASTAVTTAASNRLARTLTDAGIHVELSSTLRDVATDRLRVGSIGSFPVLYVEAVRRGGWRAVAKRTFDVVLSGSLLLVITPIVGVVALLVKLSSPGPVLFRQIRVGKDGKPFELMKFRTMVVDAERLLAELRAQNEADGPLFKIADDPRVTRVGRLLRKTSIDELPQLWNVLRGEMSLVGPRPALPSEARTWEPALHDRLRVKPGITGMWQVNGRSTSSFDQYTRLDLFYVDNWSLVRDLAILVRTLPAVVSRRGAH